MISPWIIEKIKEKSKEDNRPRIELPLPQPIPKERKKKKLKYPSDRGIIKINTHGKEDEKTQKT